MEDGGLRGVIAVPEGNTLRSPGDLDTLVDDSSRIAVARLPEVTVLHREFETNLTHWNLSWELPIPEGI